MQYMYRCTPSIQGFYRAMKQACNKTSHECILNLTLIKTKFCQIR